VGLEAAARGAYLQARPGTFLAYRVIGRHQVRRFAGLEGGSQGRFVGMAVPRHILVAERDQRTLALIVSALRAAGYATSEATTGREALKLVQMGRPELVVVGVSLPDIGGRDLARILQSSGGLEPVRTLVTAEPGAVVEDAASEAGHDSAVARWQHVDELVTIVNEMFDLSEGKDPELFSRPLSRGALKIDPNTTTVEVNGVRIELTKKEFRFLHILALNEERTCTREELKKLVWGEEADVIGRTIDVLVSRLRTKLLAASGKEVVSTVRGIGYRFIG
jgi:two-component system response regulator PrrA